MTKDTIQKPIFASNKSSIRWINLSYIVYALISVFPLFQVMPETMRRLLQLVCLCAFVIGMITLRSIKDNNLTKLIFTILLFSLVYGTSSIKQEGLSRIFVVCFMSGMPMLYAYVFFRWSSRDQCKKLLHFTLFIMSITISTTVIGLILNPGASRWMAAYRDSNAQYYSRNIGGYQWANTIPFVLLSFLFYTQGVESRLIRNRIIAIIVVSALILCSILMSYTMALLMDIMVIIMFYLNKKKPRKLIFYLVLLILMFVFKELIAEVCGLLSHIFRNEYAEISIRFQELEQYFKGGVRGSDIGSRFSLYTTSLETFLSHPLFGHHFIFIDNGARTGGHSEMLDYLASSGLAGGCALFIMMRTFAKSMNKMIRDRSAFGVMENHIGLSWLLLLFLTLVNTTYGCYGIYLSALTLPILVYKSVKSEQVIEGGERKDIEDHTYTSRVLHGWWG